MLKLIIRFAVFGLIAILAGCCAPVQPIYNHSALKPLTPSFFYKAKLTDAEKKQPVYTVLAIDGGGIAGYLPASILNYLEQKTGSHSSKLFDLMVGTSSGSLTIAGLTIPGPNGQPKYTAADIMHSFMTETDQILSTNLARKILTWYGFWAPLYRNKPRQHYVKFKYGDKLLSQALTHIVINEFSLSLRRLYAFDSYAAKKSEADNYLLRDSVLAATSTPVLFSPSYYCNEAKTFCDRGIDAAVVQNNPTLQAYMIARVQHPNAKILVVSLGTGVMNKSINRYQIEHNVTDWGIARALPYLNAMLEGDNFLFDSYMRAVTRVNDNHLLAYYRFNLNFNEKVSEFSTAQQNIKDVEQKGHELVAVHKKELNQLAVMLKSVREP